MAEGLLPCVRLVTALEKGGVERLLHWFATAGSPGNFDKAVIKPPDANEEILRHGV